MLQIAPLAFDASVRDIVGPLIAGARVVLPLPGESKEPEHLLDQIRRQGVTRLLSIVPTTLRAILAAARLEDPPADSVRTILVSGEPLRGEDCAAARRVFGPGVDVVNQYGPTECTMTSSLHRVPLDLASGAVAIGGPIGGRRFYVLDRFLGTLPVGAVGELFIAGLA